MNLVNKKRVEMPWPSTARIRLMAVALAVLGSVTPCVAEVTPEQTQELRQIKSDVAKVSTLLRKKQFDEAAGILDDADEKLKVIMEAAEVPATSRRLMGLPKLIESRREVLELQRQRASGKPANQQGMSFSNDVAPIFVEQCLECHSGGTPRAGLDLSTFTGWKRGGVGGVLLVPGAPDNSRLMARLQVNDPQHRMPRGKNALPAESIKAIATWINEGARFDGANEQTALAELAKPKPMVEIPQPKGTETVSFTKDIAPFMVRLCMNCHSGNNPRGGLSLTTFENMLVGGDSGAVIVPGKREESRLFRLTGGLENPRMPQNDSRLTRENYEHLVKWFDEGNVFDGKDPKALLTSYVPSVEELAAERFATMTDEELTAHRRERTEELWKQSLPSTEHLTLESEQFVLVGDVSQERLETVRNWADAQLQTLQKMFAESPPDAGKTVWRGKLAIIVFKERFGLNEYFLSVKLLGQPEGLFGESVVTPSGDDAYLVLLDTGDTSTPDAPGLQTSLQDHLTGAFVSRGTDGNRLLVRGIGLYSASEQFPTDAYVRGLKQLAVSRLSTIKTPQELFAEGAFAPADVGPIGFAMVDFFAQQTNRQKLVELVSAVRASQSVEEAMQTVTGSDLDTFAATFLKSVQSSR